MKLREQLEELQNSDFYPFHMPGHKRKMISEDDTYLTGHDITEIDGFDNLNCPEGILLEEQKNAASLFGSEECFYLVNGSSCGVLASIKTVCKSDNPHLLVARNSHKSVYHGLYLTGAYVKYLIPESFTDYSFCGPILVDAIKNELQDNTYDAIVLTSPTYEGVVSNIDEIVAVAHSKDIPVIVDEAHGAYLGIFGNGEYFPKSAISGGADLVIQSTHKTLPALTQTALLHVQGRLVNREKLKQNLSIFQTSSPSYLLMESISDCIHFCKENKEKLIGEYEDNLRYFYQKTNELKNLEVVDFSIKKRKESDICILKDPGKIIICTRDVNLYSGKDLYDELREKYHLQMEMSASDYVIAMTSIMDQREDFERLICALMQIDEAIENYKEKTLNTENECNEKQLDKASISDLSIQVVMKIKDAIDVSEVRLVKLEDAIGKVSSEYVFAYPPGIPIVAPGECITKEIYDYILNQKKYGMNIIGLKCKDFVDYINCVM